MYQIPNEITCNIPPTTSVHVTTLDSMCLEFLTVSLLLLTAFPAADTLHIMFLSLCACFYLPLNTCLYLSISYLPSISYLSISYLSFNFLPFFNFIPSIYFMPFFQLLTFLQYYALRFHTFVLFHTFLSIS